MRGRALETSEPLGFAAMSIPDTKAPVMPPYGTAQSLSYPGARYGGAFWSSPDGSRFFLFGGYGNAYGMTTAHLGDLWSLSCDQGQQPSLTDETTCDACSVAGTFNALLGGNCTYCGIGSVPSLNRASCQTCPDGSISVQSGVCTTCGAGTESSSDHGSCVPCAAGYFSNTSGSMCSACNAGQTSTSDDTGCISCGPVSYSASSGGTCVECPLGTVSNANHTSCVACRAGSIRNGSSMTSCVSCGDGMFSNANRTQCVSGKSWAWIRGSASVVPMGNYSFPGAYDASAAPAGRAFSALAQDGIGTVWMFGGSVNEDLFLSDLWTWNGANWRLISGSGEVNSRPELGADIQHPGATAHAAVWPSVGNGFQILGGYAFTTTYSGATLLLAWS